MNKKDKIEITSRNNSIGGKYISSGAKGFVYDVSPKTNKDVLTDRYTLYYKFNNMTPTNFKCVLYLLNGTIKKINYLDFQTFKENFKNNSKYIAKEYKKITFDRLRNFDRSPSYNFLNEITFIKKLHKLFKAHNINKFTVLQPYEIVLNEKKYKLIGLQTTDSYIVFNEKCDYPMYKIINTCKKQQFDKFINDMLEILVVLNSRKFVHGDIYFQNIMYNKNKNRYILIDYDKSDSFHSLKQKYLKKEYDAPPYGNLVYASPLMVFIKRNSFKSYLHKFMFYRNLYVEKVIFDAHCANIFYKYYNNIILESIKIIIKKYKDKSTLFDKYIQSYDTFSLGICIFIIALVNKNFTKKESKKYLYFVDLLCNYCNKNFCKNPKEAVKAWNNIQT